MEIIFAGATGTVTGSKFLVRESGNRLLVDCGLFQGYKHLRQRNWTPLPFEAGELDGVVLTHAHIDHSGYLPRLIKEGFDGPIYCTEATQELCEIMLPDSGRIQEEDAKYANKKGFTSHSPARPLYTEEMAHKALEHFQPRPYKQNFQAAQGLQVNFSQAGHILGAALAKISNQDTEILFSGDLGRPEAPLMKPPATEETPDFLVLESTYGNRSHEDCDPQQRLAGIINQTVKRDGTVLIPSFAVGRAQIISYFLQQLMEEEKIPDLPVYLDSPMAVSVTKVFNQHSALHRLDKEGCAALSEAITFTNSVEESKAINKNPNPKIVISASGMATGGRVLHHLKVYGPKEKNLVLFVGYQAPGTRGSKMLNGANSVKIHGDYIPIHAKIDRLNNLSAHSDYNEILEWLNELNSAPETTLLVHGTEESSDSLRLLIEDELGWQCHVPEYLEKARINKDEVEFIKPGVPKIHV